MRVPVDWLREYVAVPADADAQTKLLGLIGRQA